MEQVSVSKGLWRYGQVVVLLAVAGCGGGETSSSSNGTTSNVAGQGGNTVAGNAGSAGSGGSTSPSSGGTAGDSTSVVPGGNGGAAQGGTGGAAGAAAGSGGGGEGGSVGTAGAAGAAGASAAICPGGAYADSPLPEAGAMASIVCSDFTFSEGPVWLGAEGKLLFSDFGFQDAANDFPGNVMQYAPGGDCSVFASDVGSNGLAVALDGNVLGARNPTQAIASIDVATQMVTDIVTEYMGQSFSSP
ncbi:MAG TPA: hypothetical protein VHO25_03180, partial [Polyangiaceae bacterium]|nr:hypothetical protein [Polyangiaceae bacterium]